MSQSDLITHPEVLRLTGERDLLREELARLLAEAHELVETVGPNLLAMYQNKIGAWELRRLEAECGVARLRREIELAQAALNRGEAPDPFAIGAQIEAEFTTWRQRVQEAADRLRDAQLRMSHQLSPEEDREMKRLYRKLVKELHPDMNPSQGEAQAQLWRRVQDAYGRADVEELRALALMVRPPTAAPSPDPIRDLSREVADLKAQVTARIEEIDRIQKQPPFHLRESLADEAWVAARRAALEAEIASLESRREILQKQRRQILPDDGFTIEFGPN